MADFGELVEAVVRIPIGMRERPFQQLVEATGYWDRPEVVTVPLLRAALEARPGFVGNWLRLSKQVGPYGAPVALFSEPDDTWAVVSKSGGVESRTGYSDKFEACAVFVKMLVEASPRDEG